MGVTEPSRVAIHYTRLPDRLRVYDQRVVLAQPDVVITLAEPVELAEPLLHDGAVMLEHGSLVLWFTFPDTWHDIGLFHRADQTYTGLYANILTPPQMNGDVWHTTDLCLDVWVTPDGSTTILDEDDFAEAIAGGHMDEETAARARAEADRLVAQERHGAWPPPVVREWSLARALREVAMP